MTDDFRPISLRRLVRPLVRGWPLLAAAAVAAAGLAWWGTGRIPARYEATAQLLLERDRVELGAIPEMLAASLVPDAAGVSNEIAVVLSSPVLEAAAERLGMLTPPAADPAERRRQAARAVETLRRNLEVSRSLNSYVVDVTARAGHPGAAASVANTVAAAYLDAEAEEQRQAADRALGWMSGQVTELRRRIADLNQQVQAARRATVAAGRGDPAATGAQLQAVLAALAGARAERADAAARVAELATAIARDGAEAAGRVIETPEIIAARRQLADIGQRLAAESAARGAARPAVTELRAQAAALTEGMRGLVEQELHRQQVDLRLRDERIAALEAQSRQLQQDALAQEQDALAIAEVEREAEASQQLHVVLLTRLNEISAQKQAVQPDARILNAAVPPEIAAGPPRPLVVALAGVAGLLLCGVALVGAAALSGRFDSLGALEAETGLPLLGAIRRRRAGHGGRVTDPDLGPLPGEDGIEAALGATAGCPVVALAPVGPDADAEAVAARLVASAERLGRSMRLLEITTGVPGETDGRVRFRVQGIAEPDGAARADSALRHACGNADAAVMVLPPLADSALGAVWAALADATVIVVAGERPARAGALRTLARLRQAGARVAGALAVVG